MRNLYVDRDPQVELTLPRLTRTWTDICKPELLNIPGVDADNMFKFCLVQMIISDHLRTLPGKSYTKFTMAFVELLHKLICFNFYNNEDKLRDVIGPIVDALKRDTVDDTVVEDSDGVFVAPAVASGQLKGRSSKKVSGPRVYMCRYIYIYVVFIPYNALHPCTIIISKRKLL
jgi:hypothetical protein